MLSLSSVEVYSQARKDMTREELRQMDSLDAVVLRTEYIQKAKEDSTMAKAERQNKLTKAKAKKANRISNEADAAAKESKKALRLEKKAQRNRSKADRQAKKASKARDKSDKN